MLSSLTFNTPPVNNAKHLQWLTLVVVVIVVVVVVVAVVVVLVVVAVVALAVIVLVVTIACNHLNVIDKIRAFFCMSNKEVDVDDSSGLDSFCVSLTASQTNCTKLGC